MLSSVTERNGTREILVKKLIPKGIVEILCEIQSERRLCQAQVGSSLPKRTKKKTVGDWRQPGIGKESDNGGGYELLII